MAPAFAGAGVRPLCVPPHHVPAADSQGGRGVAGQEGQSQPGTEGRSGATPEMRVAATAKTHVSRVLMKLDACDRAQLVVIAYETGFITPA